MSDLEKLKNLDPQEVFKKTYIAPKVLGQLINGDFAKIGNRAKALGFVAILERELGLDLSELKAKIDEFYGQGDNGSVFEIKEKQESKSNSNRIVWILFLLVIGAGVAVYWSNYALTPKAPQNKETNSFFDVNESEENKTALDSNESEKNTTDMTVQTGVLQKEPSNETNETNQTSQIIQTSDKNLTLQHKEDENESTQEQALLPTITILPKKKIWIGIIYLDNYKRKNYLTSKPIELNTSRDQLIVTGHGLFSIEVDGQKQDFNKTGKVRMLYRAGKIEVIDATTFKQYNKGRGW